MNDINAVILVIFRYFISILVLVVLLDVRLCILKVTLIRPLLYGFHYLFYEVETCLYLYDIYLCSANENITEQITF